MKTLYALCLLTLLAVAYDVFVFRVSAVEAQGPGALTIGPVDQVSVAQHQLPEFGTELLIERTIPPSGNSPWTTIVRNGRTLVGFSCVHRDPGSSDVCFVATVGP